MDNQKKILVVDDQFGIRVLIQEVFSKDDFLLFQASNGYKALEIIDQDIPDLILLDMKMPGMDGLELLRRLRNRQIRTCIIMMTAYGELDMVDEAKRLGAVAHFTKPFDIEDLRMAVKQYLLPSG